MQCTFGTYPQVADGTAVDFQITVGIYCSMVVVFAAISTVVDDDFCAGSGRIHGAFRTPDTARAVQIGFCAGFHQLNAMAFFGSAASVFGSELCAASGNQGGVCIDFNGIQRAISRTLRAGIVDINAVVQHQCCTIGYMEFHIPENAGAPDGQVTGYGIFPLVAPEVLKFDRAVCNNGSDIGIVQCVDEFFFAADGSGLAVLNVGQRLNNRFRLLKFFVIGDFLFVLVAERIIGGAGFFHRGFVAQFGNIGKCFDLSDNIFPVGGYFFFFLVDGKAVDLYALSVFHFIGFIVQAVAVNGKSGIHRAIQIQCYSAGNFRQSFLHIVFDTSGTGNQEQGAVRLNGSFIVGALVGGGLGFHLLGVSIGQPGGAVVHMVMTGKHQVNITFCGKLIQLAADSCDIVILRMRAVGIGGFVQQNDFPFRTGIFGGFIGPVILCIGEISVSSHIIGVQNDKGGVFVFIGIIHTGIGILFGKVLEVEMGHQRIGSGDTLHVGFILVVTGCRRDGQRHGNGIVQHPAPVVFVAAVVYKVTAMEQEGGVGEHFIRLFQRVEIGLIVRLNHTLRVVDIDKGKGIILRSVGSEGNGSTPVSLFRRTHPVVVSGAGFQIFDFSGMTVDFFGGISGNQPQIQERFGFYNLCSVGCNGLCAGKIRGTGELHGAAVHHGSGIPAKSPACFRI